MTDLKALAARLSEAVENYSPREGLPAEARDAMREAAAALEAAPQWRPIEEAPLVRGAETPDMQTIDLWHRDGHRIPDGWWSLSGNCWADQDCNSYDLDEITHFMHKPQPPIAPNGNIRPA